MPTSQTIMPPGAVRYRTLTVGTGRNKRHLRIVVVPRRAKTVTPTRKAAK